MKSRVAGLWFGLLLLCAMLLPTAASATGVDLRRTLCTTKLDGAATPSAVRSARYRCDADAGTASARWLWLRLDATRVRDLPPGWTLLVDQTRFERIGVIVTGAGGAVLQDERFVDATDHWAPGGLLRFEIAPAGRDVRGLYLGFRRIDDLTLMRKVVATSEPAISAANSAWLLLTGLFAGTLLSAFLYNLVIYAGRRTAFQRWYLAWATAALAYGLVWTNTAAFVVPSLVGPIAVRLDFVLVGLMVAAGNMFFFSVIEKNILPRALVRAGYALAAAGAVLGMMAAADFWFPVTLTDRLLNYVIAGTAVVVAASCWVAVRRGSRVIWFYLIGWGPVICVFLARLARNLGFVPQSDAIDMATFAALAFEALVLSLAIADRFRSLRQELDLARQRREIDLAETKTLRRAAQTDFLTGLGNRAAFQEAAHGLIGRDTPFSLFLVDVDYLKDVNDRLGHASGDALLRSVGSALARIGEGLAGAVVTRIGGDEFAMLCPGDATVEAVLTTRMGELQGAPWQHAGQSRAISLSVGSARFPEDADGSDTLFQSADLALYHAKRLGRARHCRFDPLHRTLRDLQVEFTRDAEAALKRGEFLLYVQPIVSLATETVCGYEALLRWDHPRYGMITPERFGDVLVAERIGLRLQDHVLELALGWLARDAARIGTLSVNFTSAQLAGPAAARHVLDRLAHHGLPPSALCIEVTEGVMLDRAADSILATLRTLHDAGVSVALDDFGTGFASLVHLRQIPVDRIKIDRSFIAGLDQRDSGTMAIVRAIVGLGHGLCKVVVAEGIETEAQALQLRRLGCQLGQGYLYGRPAPHLLDQLAQPDASAPTVRLAIAG
jgi:diguanylate cyclase (GGDEF)-like protein